MKSDHVKYFFLLRFANMIWFDDDCNKSRPVEISENLTLCLMSISLSLAKTQGSVYVCLNRLLLSYSFIKYR